MQSTGINTVNNDTIALLKRVENLRKWQEEEQKKLLQAHEMQLNQFKLEQERIAKLVLQSHIPIDANKQTTTTTTPAVAAVASTNGYLVHNGGGLDGLDEDEDELDDEFHAYNQKLAQNSKLLMTQKLNYADDVEDDEDGDEFNEQMLIDMLTSNGNVVNNDRLSTIFEVSCEENTPLKMKTGDSTKQMNDAKRLLFEQNENNIDEEEGDDDDDGNYGDLENGGEGDGEIVEGDDNEEDYGDDMKSNTVKKNEFDDMPINVKPKSFDELLEEKLNEENKQAKRQQQQQQSQANGGENCNNTESKRKFLKRGEGLVRFKQPPVHRSKSVDNSNNDQQQPPPQRSSRATTEPTKPKQVTRSRSASTSSTSKPQQQNKNRPTSATNDKPVAKRVTSTQQTKQANNKSQPASNKPTQTKPTPAATSSSQPQKKQPPQSFQQKLTNNDHEDSELKEFEALEQYAEDHPSFRSTTSYVENLLTATTSNNKKLLNDIHHHHHLDNHQPKLVDLIEDLNENFHDNADDEDQIEKLNYLTKQIENDIEDDYLEQTLVNNQNEHTDNTPKQQSKTANICASSPIKKYNNYQNEEEEDDDDYGLNERDKHKIIQRKIKRINYDYVASSDDTNSDDDDDLNTKFALNSIRKRLGSIDFMQSSQESVNNLSGGKGAILTMTTTQLTATATAPTTKAYNSSSYTSTSQIEILPVAGNNQNNEFDDNSTWLDMETQNKNVLRNIPANTSSSHKMAEQQQQPQAQPVSQLMTKLFPSLKPKQTAASTQNESSNVKENRQTVGVNSDNGAMGNLLKEKLTQLESEIEKFRQKNNELTKIKEKHDTSLKELEENIEKFEKQKQDEMNKFKEYKEEEMRKLKQEKKIFEQYQKSLKEAPDRRERDEIERLKKQMNELNEDFKLKEVRWNANTKRLKDRIEQLEKERDELKNDLLLIEKQRLESMIKSNTTTTSQPSVAAQQSLNNNNRLSTNRETVLAQQKQFKTIEQQQTAAQHSPHLYVDPTLDNSLNDHQNYNNHRPVNTNLHLQQQQPHPLHQTLQNGHNDIISPINYKQIPQATQLAPFNPSITRSVSDKSLSSYSNSTVSVTKQVKYNPPNSTATQHQQQPSPQIYSPTFQQPIAHLQTNVPKPPQQQQQLNGTVKSVKFKLDNQEADQHSPSSNHHTQPNTNHHQHHPHHPPIHNHHQIVEQSHQQMVHTNATQIPINQHNQFFTSSITNKQIKVKEIQRFEDGRLEKLLDDGTLITEFANGTIKEVSGDKRHIYVNFYNGDHKEVNHDSGTETYYYAQTNVTQITYLNGLQILKFPNGQIEKHYPNKTKEIQFPDKIVKFIYPNGSEESRLTNGTIIKIDCNGDKIIDYPNKQREIHTKDYKRREYPDGSVKTVYSNGISETRYANGRIRVKDEFGNIISDKKV